jgi:putative Holliday junction resolvase
MRSLGLDVGDKRIGIALSDTLGILASPLFLLEHKDNESDIASILEIVKQYQVERIIVGLPRSMNGTIGPQAEKVKAFGDLLAGQSPVPVEYRDERLTTVSAMRMLEEAGTKRVAKGKKPRYDAEAAAIILQSFLNESRPLEWPPEDNDRYLDS